MTESKKHSLAEVINLGIAATLIDTHTALPGEVESYDPATQTAQVKIAIDRVINDEKLSFPILADVPIIFPRSQKYSVTFPLEAGDGVLLVFNERNIDNWFALGSGNEPLDARKFDINDAVAIPGLLPSLKVMTPPPVEALELRGQKLFIGDPLGSGSPSAGLAKSDIVQAIAKLIEQLLSVPLVSSMGPVNFDPAVISALQEMQTMIEGFASE